MTNQYQMRQPSWVVRITAISLVWITLFPPALLAQTVSPSAGLGATTFPFVSQPSSPNVEVPIVTHPNSLTPKVPAQQPCPVSGGAGALVPSGPLIPKMPSPESVAGAPNQPASQASAQTSTSLATAPAVSGAPLPTHPGIISPAIQAQGGEASVPRGLQPESVGQLSIEEAFSRFFILQGVTGALKQFGYNFFDAQFSAAPFVTDVPVGPDYVLGPDDTLALHIWNAPQANLNRSYIMPIERDGMMVVPQLGAIPLAGTTLAQATRLIQSRLSSLLKHFDMHLSIARLRTIKVYVVGEAVRPGAYEVSSLASASHALYAACGPAKSGSLRHIKVLRDGKTLTELDFYQFFLNGDRSQDVHLRSGDTLLVPPIGPVAAIGGPVKRPAIYEVLPGTSLRALIELAGGLSPTADRKRCQIYRIEAGQQRVIVDVDLKQPMDPALLDGDFVRVNGVSTQIENAVVLAGAVRNPGPYEFHPGMRLKDLLTSEQILPESYMDRAELLRTDPVTFEVVVQPFSPKELFQAKEENFELHRLDKIFLTTQMKGPRSVNLAGEVRRPGSYTIESGERISSVLKRAGGMTSRAFPQGVVLIRESVRKSQQAELQKFVALQKQKMVTEAANLSAGSTTPSGSGQSPEQAALQLQMQALDQMVSRLQPGRVVVKMDSIEQLQQSGEDLVLEEGDSVTIPIQPQTVSVIGSVKNPATLIAYDGLRVEDYLRQAGGFTEDANEKELYILRANGETEAAYVRLKDVRAGDTIVVPQRIEMKTKPLPLWQSIASIVGSVMLGVAAIAVIGR